MSKSNNMGLDSILKSVNPAQPEEKKTAGGTTRSGNEIKGFEIIRTPDGKVDEKASYYKVVTKFPKAWEQPIKDLAWERRQAIADLIISSVEKELEAAGKIPKQ